MILLIQGLRTKIIVEGIRGDRPKLFCWRVKVEKEGLYQDLRTPAVIYYEKY